MRFAHFLDRLCAGAEVVRAQHWSASLVQLRDPPHKRFTTYDSTEAKYSERYNWFAEPSSS